MITIRSPSNVFFRPALLLALVGAAGAPAPTAAQAQNERPPATKGPLEWHPEALKAIDELKSPYCPGFMLEVCPSPAAASLRDTIQTMAEEGLTSDSIVEQLIARYGEEWRALPKTRGEALLAWVVPPLALTLGVMGVVVVLKGMRRPRAGPAPAEVSEEERSRLDAALRDLEAEEETLF